MSDYQDLIKKLSQINEGASIVSLDVNASANDQQQIKTVIVGVVLNSGAQISATFQAPCFETLLDALETFFSIQGQVIEQAIDQVNVMASTCQDMNPVEPSTVPVQMEPMGDDEYSFDLGGDESGMEPEMGHEAGGEMEPEMDDDITDNDVVVDPDEMEPEMGDDVDTDEARYSHNYSFRNNGSGLFQSLTGAQRIQKGALRTAKKRLGN